MALTKTKVAVMLAKGVHSTTWTFTGTSAGAGDGQDLPQYPDKSVQISGTFGGGTVVIQGTNADPTASKWSTLADPNGNAMSYTTTTLEQILEITRYIRPNMTVGGAAGAITVRCISSAYKR